MLNTPYPSHSQGRRLRWTFPSFSAPYPGDTVQYVLPGRLLHLQSPRPSGEYIPSDARKGEFVCGVLPVPVAGSPLSSASSPSRDRGRWGSAGEEDLSSLTWWILKWNSCGMRPCFFALPKKYERQTWSQVAWSSRTPERPIYVSTASLYDSLTAKSDSALNSKILGFPNGTW